MTTRVSSVACKICGAQHIHGSLLIIFTGRPSYMGVHDKPLQNLITVTTNSIAIRASSFVHTIITTVTEGSVSCAKTRLRKFFTARGNHENRSRIAPVQRGRRKIREWLGTSRLNLFLGSERFVSSRWIQKQWAYLLLPPPGNSVHRLPPPHLDLNRPQPLAGPRAGPGQGQEVQWRVSAAAQFVMAKTKARTGSRVQSM